MGKRKLIIVLITILIIMALLALAYIFIFRNLKSDENIVTAFKTITEEDEEQKIEYTIEIDGYTIKNIQKEIKYGSKEKAESEYNRYEIINNYENKGMEIKLKNKTLTLILTEEVFLDEIGYTKKDNIKLISNGGDVEKVIDKQRVIELLEEQGYTIK